MYLKESFPIFIHIDATSNIQRRLQKCDVNYVFHWSCFIQATSEDANNMPRGATFHFRLYCCLLIFVEVDH